MVKSEVNGVVTYYAGSHYHKVVNGESDTVRKFYTAGSEQVAMRYDGVLTWMLSDHLGSANVTANENCGFLSEQRYTAFGEVRLSSGETETPYQYTGQLSQMEEIGLYYYVARWYDPVIAHIGSADTIIPEAGKAAAFDRFAYLNNNPINGTDPTGHTPMLIGAGIGAIAGLAIYTAYSMGSGHFDIGQAVQITGTFALAGALIGTGVGAAAGIGMAVNASLAVAAGSVGAGVAGGAYGYLAQSAARGTEFDGISFAVSSSGGAIDGGITAAVPSQFGRMAASGLLTGAQSGIDAKLHGQKYSSNDFLDNFAGGVIARGFGEKMGLDNYGHRYATEFERVLRQSKLTGVDTSFAIQAVAKQEIAIGVYDSIRAGLVSSDTMKGPFKWVRQLFK